MVKADLAQAMRKQANSAAAAAPPPAKPAASGVGVGCLYAAKPSR